MKVMFWKKGKKTTDTAAAKSKKSLLQQLKQEAHEGDDKPSGALKLRDILGGDYLITLVRKQMGLIVVIATITTAYVAIRYQCQQDLIDIGQLETEVLDAKYRAMASASTLTEMCRQNNILDTLQRKGITELQPSKQPPFNIFVPEQK